MKKAIDAISPRELILRCEGSVYDQGRYLPCLSELQRRAARGTPSSQALVARLVDILAHDPDELPVIFRDLKIAAREGAYQPFTVFSDIKMEAEE